MSTSDWVLEMLFTRSSMFFYFVINFTVIALSISRIGRHPRISLLTIICSGGFMGINAFYQCYSDLAMTNAVDHNTLQIFRYAGTNLTGYTGLVLSIVMWIAMFIDRGPANVSNSASAGIGAADP